MPTSGGSSGSPASGVGYTTLAAVKAELKIAVTTDDALLSGYVSLAQRIIEANPPLGTGRLFEVASDSTKYFDVPSGLVLNLRGQDLCSITTVTNGDGTVVPSTAYVTRPRDTAPYYALKLKQTAGYVWTWTSDGPEGAIGITGKWGYSAAAPLDIQRCALRIAVWLYKSRDNAGFDVDIKTDEGLILGARMPRDIRQIIETYWGLT